MTGNPSGRPWPLALPARILRAESFPHELGWLGLRMEECTRQAFLTVAEWQELWVGDRDVAPLLRHDAVFPG